MTKARKAVLDVVREIGTPASAQMVHQKLGALCDSATVYRSLEYLEENGELESFILRCSEHGTERYYIPGGTGHKHWFHCENCHKFVDLGTCQVGEILTELGKRNGLSIRHHTLFATGICAECLEKGSAASGEACVVAGGSAGRAAARNE
jgi:Fur family ferric uptake transcriptional regulator